MSNRSSLSRRDQTTICTIVAVGGKLTRLTWMQPYTAADIRRSLERDPRFARRFRAAQGRRYRLAPDKWVDRPVKSVRAAIERHRIARAELDELLFVVEQRRAN